MKSAVSFSIGFVFGRVGWPLVKHLAYWLLIGLALTVWR